MDFLEFRTKTNGNIDIWMLNRLTKKLGDDVNIYI